jgi:hypothetical protein
VTRAWGGGGGRGERTHHPMLGRGDESGAKVMESVVAVGGCTIRLILRAEGEASTRGGVEISRRIRGGGENFSLALVESSALEAGELRAVSLFVSGSGGEAGK